MPQVAELLITIALTIEVSTVPPAQNPPEAESGSSGVMLQWDAPVKRENGESLELDEISGYDVVYQRSGDEAQTLNIADANQHSVELTDLEAGDYTYKVRAIDAEGNTNQYSEIVGSTVSP